MSKRPPPLRIAVLISGSGSTLDNLATRIADGRLSGMQIVLVVSSRADVKGVEIARRHGLPLHVIRRAEFPDEQAFSDALTRAIEAAGADLVVMAGFLCFWRIPPHLEHRVLNIHPALLPAFGGRGMHGAHVHAAVLAAGVRESGCTVHFADNEYDHGPIIARRTVPVLPGDTSESLAARVMEQERELYPAVLQEIADSGLPAVLQRVLRA